MKDHLLQVATREPLHRRLNIAREYLQVYLLRLLHEAGATTHLAFVGGTALRLLYALPRFSEDLDFSTSSSLGGSSTDYMALFRQLKKLLEEGAYKVTVKAKVPNNVAYAFYRFEGLPSELGWSSDPRQALAVKIEIDVRPPAGAEIETSLVQRFFPLAVRHYDLPSLFAGKLHAILARPYTKGRDWFDLAWYLTSHKGLEPNLRLLENALEQSGHGELVGQSWRHAVGVKVRSLKWETVVQDLQPLLERESDLQHLRQDLLEKLLGSH